MVIDDIDFLSLPIWIQVHDLPIECMSKENAEEIGALIGDVIDVDFTSNGGICLSKHLRIKVELKYEKVADFYYKCGGLGHLKARCVRDKYLSDQPTQKEPFGYGPWMKAELTGKITTR